MARTPPGHRDRLTPAECRNPFASDLSVNEFVLIENAGFEPLGLVRGTSIYQMGFQWARWDRNQEITALSQALYGAREAAMTRMEDEADAIGADGIVGVRLEVRKAPWTRHVTEFFAVGTAVRDIHGVSHRTVHHRPFTSALSGQEFWLLMQYGYRPVSLVLGNAVYHVAWRNVANSLWAWGRSLELPHYTQAFYSARELAGDRLHAEAADAEADGVVGVRLEEHPNHWMGRFVEFLAIGTAVERFRDSAIDPPTSF